MAAINMTNPAADNSPFPNTVIGDYTPVAVGTQIIVVIRQEDDPTKTFNVNASVDGAGGWSAAKPGGLTAGKKYTITAGITAPTPATCIRTGIQN